MPCSLWNPSGIPDFQVQESVGISGLQNFQIRKRVTNREDEREDESDEWKRNSRDSNLNSGYLGTEYKYL